MLLIISTSAAITIGAYLVAYQKVFKFPRPVRKVRSFRNKLKKKKAPKLTLASRDETLDSIYQAELGDFSKKLKIKYK